MKKLDFKQSVVDIATECYRQDIQILGINPKHCELIKTLPAIHNDPFDRMIIAQAVEEKMSVITKDEKNSTVADFLYLVD